MPNRGELSPLQVLLLESESGWIAQGIQHDISVEADSLEDLLYEFERAMIGHFYMSLYRGVEPFEHMPPAPDECAELWRRGIGIALETRLYRAEADEAAPPPPSPAYRIVHASNRPSAAESHPS